MKNLLNPEFCVELGDVKLYFKKPTRKELMESPQEIGTMEYIFSKLVRVEGADISEVTTLDLPFDAARAVVEAYHSKVLSWFGVKEADQKNGQEPPSSGS